MFELPFERAVERQARPKAIFGKLNPAKSLGITATIHTKGNPGMATIRPAHLAEGGGIMSSPSGFEGLEPISKPPEFSTYEYDDPMTSAFASQSGIGQYGMGIPGQSQQASSLTGGDDKTKGLTGFRGWLANEHGGIKGADILKALIQGSTGILAGIAQQRNSMAKGGEVKRYAKGGKVASDTQSKVIAMNAVKAIMGQSEDPQGAIQAFVSKFGPEALQQLQQQIGGGQQQQQAPGAGIVNGPGDGMSDNVPAMLSQGEHVLDSDTVSAIGNGSNEAGHQKLNAAKTALRHKKYGRPSQPPRVSDKDNPVLRSIR